MEGFIINNNITPELRDDIIQFITSVILKDENTYRDILISHNGINLINNNNEMLFDMIKLTTESFFNNLYKDIKNNTLNEIITKISNSSKLNSISSFSFLNIAFKVKFYCHISMNRKAICISDKEAFEQSIINQINLYIQNNQILNYFDIKEVDNFISKDKVFIIESKKILVERNKESSESEDNEDDEEYESDDE